MSCEIRAWTPDDLPAVRSICWNTWQATYSSFIPVEDLRNYFEEHYSPADLDALYNEEGIEGFVGEVEGTVLGYEINRFAQDEGRYYVVSLYILPQHQGHGMGNLLLRQAERRALAHGLDRIWLGVMVENKATVEWYLRRGFVFPQQEPFTMGKTTVQHYIGYKLIDDQTQHAESAGAK